MEIINLCTQILVGIHIALPYCILAYIRLSIFDHECTGHPKGQVESITENRQILYGYLLGVQHVCHKLLAYGSHVELAYCIAR
jgi:hypothetical protein